MLIGDGGICFVHGPFRGTGCPYFPACASEPTKPEYVTLLKPATECPDCDKHMQSVKVFHGLWKKEAEWVNKLMAENRELQDKLNAADAIIGQHFQAQPDIGMDTPNYVCPSKYHGLRVKLWQDAMADAKGLYRPVLDIDVKVQDE